MRRPRVLVAGAFGQGNPGDESVLRAFVSGLDGCEVAATVALAPVGGRCRPVPSADRAAVARAVMWSDLTVVTATVFKTLHRSTGRPPLGLLCNTLALSATARAAGRPVVLAGVGAGELRGRTAGLLSRAVVASADTVELRDEESAATLRAAGVRRRLAVGADVVWASLPRSLAAPHRRRLAVITLSHLAGGPELVRCLASTAEALAADGYEVALQPWQLPRDQTMAAEVMARAGVGLQLWEPPHDVADAARTLAGASVVVGLRFHSLLAAGASGVPFVAVTHEAKLAGLARRLGQPAVAPGAPAEAFIGAARRAVAGPAPDQRRVEEERRLAAAVLGRTRETAFRRAAARSAGFGFDHSQHFLKEFVNVRR